LHQALPSARAATVNLLNDMYGRVVPEGSASIEALGTYNDAHDVLDKDLPVKFEEAYEKAVLGGVKEWMEELLSLKAALKDMDDKRVIFDHYKAKVRAGALLCRALAARARAVSTRALFPPAARRWTRSRTRSASCWPRARRRTS